MRELLTLGVAQYVNIYYRTPQLVRKQQLETLLRAQFRKATVESKGNSPRKNDV
jgi:hypothetical protein